MVAPKGVENSMGELVQEIPQDSEITELQVPLVVQVPAPADRIALSLNFRLTGVLQQRHLIVQQWRHRIYALYRWLSK